MARKSAKSKAGAIAQGSYRVGNYGNKIIQTEDGKFDSQAELSRWLELKILLAGRHIYDLARQVSFDLTVNQVLVCRYIADYVYFETGTKRRIVEDVKGHRTPVFILKKALMRACHGIEVYEFSASKARTYRKESLRATFTKLYEAGKLNKPARKTTPSKKGAK